MKFPTTIFNCKYIIRIFKQLNRIHIIKILHYRFRALETMTYTE